MTDISRDDWEALRPLLDEALELPAGARPGWLAQQRRSNPRLARAVEDLLNRESMVDEEGFLDPGRLPGIAGSASSLAGQTLGPYLLERPLGHGGMGSVWLARRNDGRYEGAVAIKFLNLSASGPIGEARFRQEGAVLARLTHPNIARLLDAGVSTIGQPYLVLEHVDGQPIDRWCDTRKLGVDGRIRIFLQVLDAVSHAHANLIVHRDLKPSNILVARDGTVKLLDFGIAKLLEQGDQARLSLTASREAVLTFEYAAPEQIRAEPITTATDVYSLGVILYGLFTGRHPILHNQHTPAEQMRAILDTDPGHLSRAVTPSGAVSLEEAAHAAEVRDASPERLRRLYAGDLDNILAKALRKAPAERYSSVSAFADDLSRYLEHKPVAARGDAWTYRAGKFLRRHRGSVSTAVLTALALIGTMLVAIHQAREAGRQRDSALFHSRIARAESEFQELMLGSFGDGKVSMREILDQGRILLREFSSDPRVASALALSLGHRYGDLGQYGIEEELLDQADSFARAAGTGEALLLNRCNRAYNLERLHQRDRAIALMDSVRPRMARLDSSDLADCLNLGALLQVRTEQFDSAAAAGRRSAAILERLGDTTGLRYLGVLNTVANALENGKHGREALAMYQRIAAVMDSTGRGRTQDRNVLRNNIGIALSNLGEMLPAEAILHETMMEFRRTNAAGEVHPFILGNYAKTVLFLRRLDSAEVWYRRLVTQSEAHHDPDMQTDGLYGLIEVLLLQGRLDEAGRTITEMERVNPLLARPRPANAPAMEGALALRRGDPATALRQLREALDLLGYATGKRPYQMRSVLIYTAEAALAADRPADAIEYARAARLIAGSDSLTEVRSGLVGEARLLEGQGLLASGDTAAAIPVLQRSLVALRFGVGPDHPRTLQAEELLAALHH
jgi:eukaryotic-like serine/threonine-protein kinase